MYYSNKEHYLFLEEELRAQTERFQQKLNTAADYLLNIREELFLAKFVKFENGEMILKFSNRRGIPRKGEYLYCFTTPKQYHNYKEWGKTTYGDLIKSKGCATELVCVWQYALRDDPQYCLVGFRGVDVDFAEHIDGHAGAFLVLGPNTPPYQYIENLQNLIKRSICEPNDRINSLLCDSTTNSILEPYPLEKYVDSFLLQQITLGDSIILQGPPGTGKTSRIAKLCEQLCKNGHSVLVTALTNRALMEVAEKDCLAELLNGGFIHKTKLSVDESKELPDLRNMKQISAMPGNIVLSTFYITSGEACNTHSVPPFDYVIMDEASQALLGMFAAVQLLGKKCIYVGDQNQLPPVISLNVDRIVRRNYSMYIDGFQTIISCGRIPNYRLVKTYRLPQRAAKFTGIFYNNTLTSASNTTQFTYTEIDSLWANLFNKNGGPTLLKTDMLIADKKPVSAILLSVMLVSQLLQIKKKLHISVLSFYVETTKALQRAIYQTIGSHNNLLVDTVSRIQGLTTDVAIYVVPNTSYLRTLDRRLFNVATSRAQRHTIIITDNHILDDTNTFMDNDVKQFLTLLNKTSFYIPMNINANTKAIGVGVQQQAETLQLPKFIEIYQEDNEDSKTEDIKEDTIIVEDEPQTNPSDNFIKTEIPTIKLKVVGKIDLSKFETKKQFHASCIYILDTNVFVDCPNIIDFIEAESTILLSAKVVDELDKLKITLDEIGKQKVQNALRNINKLMDKRDIRFEVANTRLLPHDLDYRSPDNMILSIALKYKSQNPILITSDNGLQIKAKGLGITTISLKDFLRERRH